LGKWFEANEYGSIVNRVNYTQNTKREQGFGISCVGRMTGSERCCSRYDVIFETLRFFPMMVDIYFDFFK
jgi:hypothetical protein